MSIYLDANVLPVDSHVASLGFSAVRAVAQASGQQILVPEIALNEAVARREREVADSQREVKQIVDRWRRMGIDAEVPLLQDSSELAASWKEQLIAMISVLPTPDDVFAEGIRREIYRIPPAREGRGARDAIIWLTILRNHSKATEPSFFVTQNTKDFADPQDRNRFHKGLLNELDGIPHLLEFCNGPVQLLDRLAAKVESRITAAALATDVVVRNAVAAFVSSQEFLDRVLLEPAVSMLFVASPVEATPLAVNSSETYRAGAIDVSVVWVRWKVGFVLGFLLPHGNRSFSQELRPITLELDLQMWLRRQGAEERWTEAEVSAPGTIELKRA